MGASGLARIELLTADAGSVAKATGMDIDQADVIVKYVQGSTSATMADFIRRQLSQLNGPTCKCSTPPSH